MENIFLAFSFNEDRQLIFDIDELLYSYNIKMTTGELLGGEQLEPAVQDLIKKCDGLIGLLTRRNRSDTGKWDTHEWVKNEIAFARNNGIHAIAIVEQGVDVGGMYASHEYIPLDRSDPYGTYKALFELAKRIGKWNKDAGRRIKVRIMPDDLATLLRRPSGNFKCRYRFFDGRGNCTEWRDVRPIPLTGGTFVYMNGVCEEHSIQLEVQGDVQGQPKIWISKAECKWQGIE
jgi:hypothetical protein